MHPARSGGGGRCSSLDAPKRVVRVCWKHEAETLSQSDHTTAQSYNLLGGLFSVPPTRGRAECIEWHEVCLWGSFELSFMQFLVFSQLTWCFALLPCLASSALCLLWATWFSETETRHCSQKTTSRSIFKHPAAGLMETSTILSLAYSWGQSLRCAPPTRGQCTYFSSWHLQCTQEDPCSLSEYSLFTFNNI